MGRSDKPRLTGMRLMTEEETKLAKSSLQSWTGIKERTGHRPAASVCHAVSINVVKHDGANAKPCDSMQNGMERHGMAEK